MAEALCLLLLTSCLSISEPAMSAADDAPPETEVAVASADGEGEAAPREPDEASR